MAKAVNFQSGRTDDLIIDSYLQMAAAEIFSTYGHRVRINRKTLNKYGKNAGVTTR